MQSAVEQAKAFAGHKAWIFSPGNVGGQALAAGLVDELRVDLVPMVFGDGVRYFGDDGGMADPRRSSRTRRSFKGTG